MANEFKRNVGSQISKKEAQEWIAKYDKERKKDTTSVFYGRDCIEAIFKDPQVTGISFFFARKKNKEGRELDDLVLVGTKEDGTLVWNEEAPSSKDDGASSQTYDGGLPCPPYCPK
jgi:hypothetical protein